MTELYENVSDEVRQVAELSWKIAMTMKNPVESAKFLDNVTNFYAHRYTEEEIEFLRFYFNLRMEMIINE